MFWDRLKHVFNFFRSHLRSQEFDGVRIAGLSWTTDDAVFTFLCELIYRVPLCSAVVPVDLKKFRCEHVVFKGHLIFPQPSLTTTFVQVPVGALLRRRQCYDAVSITTIECSGMLGGSLSAKYFSKDSAPMEPWKSAPFPSVRSWSNAPGGRNRQ